MNASDWSVSDVFKTMISGLEIPEEMARKSFKTCGILNALTCNDLCNDSELPGFDKFEAKVGRF